MLAKAAVLRSVAAAAARSSRSQTPRNISYLTVAARGLPQQQRSIRFPHLQLPSLPISRGFAKGAGPKKDGTQDVTSGKSSEIRKSPAPSPEEPILPTDGNVSPLSQQEPATVAETGVAGAPPPPSPEDSDAASRILPGHGRGADGLPKSAYISSTDRKRERIASLMFALSIGMIVGGGLYLGRDWDTKEEEKAHAEVAPNGLAPGLIYKRIQARIRDILDYYNEPVFDKLLPDPIPDPDYQRPYTLVLGLDDLLVHTEWDREHGWRTAKRPGLDYFLGYLSMYYELVVFSDQPSYLSNPILEKLNAYPGYISHGLAREATRYKGGHYVKDLSHLNRDLSKVILVDTKKEAGSMQPTNTIIIPPWDGNPKDRELIPLLNVLEFIAGMGVPDVRPVIADFGDKQITTEFALREAAARKRFEERLEEERLARGKEHASSGGLMKTLLGIKPAPEREKAQEMMLQDQIRERGQQNYRDMINMVMSQKDKFEEEERQRQKELAEAMKTSLSKILTEGLPKQPGQPGQPQP